MSKSANIAVAVSGSGRSLENLIEQQSCFAYNVAGVISSNPLCRANDIAIKHEKPLFIGNFADPYTEHALLKWLALNEISWIVLAGFIKKFPNLSSNLTPKEKLWDQKVINIHPALLPKYGGKGMYGNHVHKAVIDAKEEFSGASIHFVDANYDEGKLITQKKVALSSDETVESLAKKVFAVECEILPRTIHDLVKK